MSDSVEKLLDEILAPNTDEGIGTDNMTAILIKFKTDSDKWEEYWAFTFGSQDKRKSIWARIT